MPKLPGVRRVTREPPRLFMNNNTQTSFIYSSFGVVMDIINNKLTMEKNLKEKRFIINNIINRDTKICRYMNFDSFLIMLEGKFYVSRKQKFFDHRESGKIPIKHHFVFSAVSEYIAEKDNIVTKRQEIRFINNLAKSRFLLTSCWTINNGENYLMWKGYTEKIGVCVCTTIGKLIDSIDYEKLNYIPICSPMFYERINMQEDFLQSTFTKELFYESEKEIRFYFVPTTYLSQNEEIGNDDVENILLKTSEEEEKIYNSNSTKYEESIVFDFKADAIDNVIISPFVLNSSVSYFRKILKNQYPKIFNDYNIKESALSSIKSK